MNGSEKVIYDAVKDNGNKISKLFTSLGELKITQKLQHVENKGNISELKKDVKLYASHSSQIKVQWGLLLIVLGWLVKLSLN